MAQINGPESASSVTGWTDVSETVIRFGLLPPLDIEVTGQTSDSVTLSWDPGSQPGIIHGVKVYWDTDSGSSSAYAFNSDTHFDQVTFGAGTPPTSATIDGLTAGQTYHFTVTFENSFTQPGSTIAMDYESKLFPDTLSGNGFTYPQEVTGTPTLPGCTPGAEVANLALAHAGGADTTFSWDTLADACVDHYVLLGSDDPSAGAGGFVEVASGPSTSFTGNPPYRYYLVVAEGAGGQRGPLGHFGQ
jgi:hypothetical protein